jgi:zinc D-Ala-D-Ala carboxypeptidase
MLPAQDFMDKVEKLRVAVGFPLRVTSAARCPDHNAKVSGTGRTGPHTTGRAIDLGVSHAQAYWVLAEAFRAGFTGIGVNQKGGSRFIHIDDLTAGRPTVWSY